MPWPKEAATPIMHLANGITVFPGCFLYDGGVDYARCTESGMMKQMVIPWGVGGLSLLWQWYCIFPLSVLHLHVRFHTERGNT